MLLSYVNPRIQLSYAIVRQGQSFRLARPLGEGTGGLKTPGYSKTVLRTESVAAAPHRFKHRCLQWLEQPHMVLVPFATGSDHGLAYYFAAAMVNLAPAATRPYINLYKCSPRP